MCGISGIFGIKGKRKNFAKDIFLLSQRIKHRGPDGEGMVFFQAGKAKPVFSPDTPISCRNNELPYSPGEPYEANQEDFIGGFAHRRLSILDLSKSGHQPMCTANQRYWISYNGEIYNYRAISKELEAKGIKFFSMSDTEMLVNAFAVWGIDFLEKISKNFKDLKFLDKNNEIFESIEEYLQMLRHISKIPNIIEIIILKAYNIAIHLQNSETKKIPLPKLSGIFLIGYKILK
jgi:asparagine synthase (glutamine-hydrolysing)